LNVWWFVVPKTYRYDVEGGFFDIDWLPLYL